MIKQGRSLGQLRRHLLIYAWVFLVITVWLTISLGFLIYRIWVILGQSELPMFVFYWQAVPYLLSFGLLLVLFFTVGISFKNAKILEQPDRLMIWPYHVLTAIYALGAVLDLLGQNFGGLVLQLGILVWTFSLASALKSYRRSAGPSLLSD